MRKHLKNHLPNHEAIHNNRWLRPFRNSLLHPRLWHLNRHSAAGAVAAGMFCGLIPGPFQMIGAAVCALIFPVNLPLAMFVTLYTNPFTIVPLYLVAYQIGRLATRDSAGFSEPPDFDMAHAIDWMQAMLTWMIGVGKPLGIGLALLAITLAVAGYFLGPLADGGKSGGKPEDASETGDSPGRSATDSPDGAVGSAGGTASGVSGCALVPKRLSWSVMVWR